MVFDIRGRRKTAVKVVYAVLAVLMGLSLFLVTGGLNLGELFNGGGGTSSAAKQFEEEAEKFEVKLKANPEDPDLLYGLTRSRVNAGTSLNTINPETGQAVSTAESRQQYQLASDSWSRYLKQTDEPSSGLAQLMAQALVALTIASRTVSEEEANIHGAVQAQQIVADRRPSVNSLTTLATYNYFAFDYKAGEEAKKEALALAHGEAERQEIKTKLANTRKQAEGAQLRVENAEKEAKQNQSANQNQGEAGGTLGGGGLGGTLGGTGLGE
jgi:hypothetical protein